MSVIVVPSGKSELPDCALLVAVTVLPVDTSLLTKFQEAFVKK